MKTLRQRMSDKLVLTGKAKSTSKSYLYHVTQLANYYDRSPETLTEPQIQDYLLYCHQEKGWAFSTCRQFIHAANFLYKVVLDRPLSSTTLPIPPKEQKIPDLLNQTQVHDIIAACDNQKYKVALKTVYATGLRVSELVKLQIADLDGERNTIRITYAKGRKDRLIDFPDGLKDCLRDYWRLFGPQSWLFYSRHHGQALAKSTIQQAFKRALKASGVLKDCGIHGLRHAYASQQLEAGMPLPQLQHQLGHSDIRTTLRYTRWLKNVNGGDKFDLLKKITDDES